mgnify:CR=1 FL=1
MKVLAKPKKKSRLTDYVEGKYSLTNEEGTAFIVGEVIFNIWVECDGHTEISEIIANTAKILRLDQEKTEELKKAVPDIINQLVDKGLITSDLETEKIAHIH